jgi:uncharacterized cupin superfamily protein
MVGLVADPNVHEPEWESDNRDTSVRNRTARLGAAAGARDLGAAVYELEPGGAVAPYHLHHGNEELLVVLRGRPVLRTPEGVRSLEEGAVVAFLPGPGGAHRITNPGPDPVRVLLISTMRFPEIAEHISTGTTMAMTGPGEGKVFPSGTDQEFLTMYLAAIAADQRLDDSAGR